MQTLVVDLEATTGTLHKRKASPFNPSNWVVAAGYKIGDTKPFGSYFNYPDEFSRHHLLPLKHIDLLIMHNAKYDMLWMWPKPEFQEFLRNGGKIYCTEYAEYLLNGMVRQSHMVPMDAIVEKYGGTLKISDVKTMWEQGIDTDQIDPDLLCDYLLGNERKGIEGDINNTYLIYKGQQEQISKLGKKFKTMLANRMDGLLCTTEMEYNGLYVDTVQGEEDRINLLNELSEINEALEEYLPQDLPFEFNWKSIYHRSYLLFGGTAKYEQWEQHRDDQGKLLYCQKKEVWPTFHGEAVNPKLCEWDDDEQCYWYISDGEFYFQDTYRSGKRQGEGKTKQVTVPDHERPKGSKQEKLFRFNGYLVPKPEWETSVTDAADNPVISTSSDVMDALAVKAKASNIRFLKLITDRQRIVKDIGTYYWSEDDKGQRKGMLTLVGDDSVIHHKLNHVNTVTSRLSSSDPNMQNIPRGDKSLAKRMFSSRFGEDGVMAEVDYSQLEVIVQAVLSNDKQMRLDINNKIDFHVKRLATSQHKEYEEVLAKYKSGCKKTDQERRLIKTFTFQRAYGAGAASIADSTGMKETEVKKLIKAEEKLYPNLTRFNEQVAQTIRNTKYLSHHAVIDGHNTPIYRGKWTSPTGTRYIFEQKESPSFLKEEGKMVTFSPTEIKNYPVQGTAGEIVQTMLGLLFRYFIMNHNFENKAFLVNTVHDCVWIDLHKSVARSVVNSVCKILEAVPRKFNKDFNLGIDVPFRVESEVGKDMYTMIHFPHT